jgi:FlaA1/EpsC-like NDP-sugar epimerase
VIRSGSLSARSGEVFVLEMGEPIKIMTLAETMIRLSGFEPGREIAIEVVGARPGEKFQEVLLNPYERSQPTAAQKIIRAERARLDPDWVKATFDHINLLVLEGDAAALAEHVSKLDAQRAAGHGTAAARSAS